MEGQKPFIERLFLCEKSHNYTKGRVKEMASEENAAQIQVMISANTIIIFKIWRGISARC